MRVSNLSETQLHLSQAAAESAGLHAGLIWVHLPGWNLPEAQMQAMATCLRCGCPLIFCKCDRVVLTFDSQFKTWLLCLQTAGTVIAVTALPDHDY